MHRLGATAEGECGYGTLRTQHTQPRSQFLFFALKCSMLRSAICEPEIGDAVRMPLRVRARRCPEPTSRTIAVVARFFCSLAFNCFPLVIVPSVSCASSHKTLSAFRSQGALLETSRTLRRSASVSAGSGATYGGNAAISGGCGAFFSDSATAFLVALTVTISARVAGEAGEAHVVGPRRPHLAMLVQPTDAVDPQPCRLAKHLRPRRQHPLDPRP